MIQDITIYLCSHKEYFHVVEFYSRNTETFSCNNIVYPELINGPSLQGAICDPFSNLLQPHGFQTLKSILYKINSDTYPLSEAMLLFILPHMPPFTWVSKFITYLREVYTDSEIRILFCMTPQEQVYQAAAHHAFSNSGLYPDLTRAIQLRKGLLSNYAEALQCLHGAVGKDSVVSILPLKEAGWPETWLAPLCNALGFDAHALETLNLASFSPRSSALLPREVACFAGNCNIGRTPQTLAPGGVRRWTPHAHLFTAGSGYRGSPYGLLSPDTLAQVAREFADSNQEAAELLGLPKLFADFAPESDWRPWEGMTPDTAYAIAERLDEEFRQDLLGSFETLPTEQQSRDQRICHQALLEVGASRNGGMVPPRRYAEQPAKVAVLTLAYNHREFIEDCIKTVLDQKTDFPIEHIIVDDASDDGTQEIIKEYASRYRHITPYLLPHRSYYGENVRTLFSLASSPYVALCDGDDYFTDPHKLQIQADFLDATPECAVCFHPVRVLYEGQPDKERLYPTVEALPRGVQSRYYITDLIRGNFMQTNSVMYRWRFPGDLPDWFKPYLVPGDWYWHLLHAEKGEIGFLNRIMSVYRRHEKGIYYLAEVDNLRLRYNRGWQELQMFQAVDEHFKGAFRKIILSMTSGILADMFTYASEVGDVVSFEQALKDFPLFGKHFFDSIQASLSSA